MTTLITLQLIKDINKYYNLIKIYQNRCKEGDRISKEGPSRATVFNSSKPKTI